MESVSAASRCCRPKTIRSPRHEANHINGAWFQTRWIRVGCSVAQTRSITAAFIMRLSSRGTVKFPSGLPYKNDAECWAFLEDQASKAARWLGYVPFEKIIDARNASRSSGSPRPQIRDGRSASSRNLESARRRRPEPKICVDGFIQPQLYRLVFFGEKTSLGEVLLPIS